MNKQFEIAQVFYVKQADWNKIQDQGKAELELQTDGTWRLIAENENFDIAMRPQRVRSLLFGEQEEEKEEPKEEAVKEKPEEKTKHEVESTKEAE